MTPSRDLFRRPTAVYGGAVARDRGDSPTLNLKQAARALGVHYTTAYRYVRQGRLPARREGTEWRVPTTAVDDFQHHRTSTGRAPTDPGADRAGGGRSTASGDGRRGARWDQRLAPALRAGDEPAAWRVIQQALDAGHDLSFCYLDMIAPALAEIDRRPQPRTAGLFATPAPPDSGDRAEDDRAGQGEPDGPGQDGENGTGTRRPASSGEVPALQPILAAVVAQRLVARLGPGFRRPGRTRGTVVLGGPSGERHQLPLSILADLIRGAGFGVVELGADVGAETFVAAAASSDRLIAVALGVTSIDRVEELRRTIEVIRRSNEEVPIVVGGQGVQNADVAELVEADAWAPNGRRAVELIGELARQVRVTPPAG